MQHLVLYYSRTGRTALVAKSIAERLGCDIEGIEENKDRRGIFGYIIGGYEAIAKKSSSIGKLKQQPEKYDSIIIGQPVWGGMLVPAVRTLLKKHDLAPKQVALFATMDGSGGERCNRKTEELIGKPAAAKAVFVKPHKQQDEKALDSFISRISQPARR